MTPEELADRIVEITIQHGDATHGTIINNTEQGVLSGDMTLSVGDMNLVFAVGINTLFADAMDILMKERPLRVEISATDFLVACYDATPMPSAMPWAKKPPKKGYKEPHFVPFLLRPVKT